MKLEQIRRALYFTQRTIGDAQAAKRGTLTQRLVRRQERRLVGRALSRWGL